MALEKRSGSRKQPCLSLSKYLHSVVRDGPAARPVSDGGHIRAKNGARERPMPPRRRVTSRQLVGMGKGNGDLIRFFSSQQAPTTDLPLKHVETMVSR